MTRYIWPTEIKRLEMKLLYNHSSFWVRRGLTGKQRCPRKPMVELDAVIHKIIYSETMARYTPRAETAYQYLMHVNDTVLKNMADNLASSSIMKNVKKRADMSVSKVSLNFWACEGDYSWINNEDIMQEFLDFRKDTVSTKETLGKRVRIPQAVRFALWNSHFGEHEGVGRCYCCKNVISQQNFEAGHVKAVANNGSNDITNLRPICSVCNKSMGTQDMYEFIREYFSSSSE